MQGTIYGSTLFKKFKYKQVMNKIQQTSPMMEIFKGIVGFICKEGRPTEFRTGNSKVYLPIYWMKGGIS